MTGLCSKCYREAQATEKAAGQAQQVAEQAVSPSPIPAEEMSAVEAPAPEVAAPAPAVSSPAEPPAPEHPIQANRGRCFSCSKKVGLLGFECRCGYVYCSGHRHAQDHACTFDYAAMDRERLAQANPLVAAAKVDKL